MPNADSPRVTKRNILGPAIKDVRRRRGHSQRRLAELLARRGWKSATRQTVAEIENGSRCIADYELVSLGMALKIPLNKLAKGCSAEALGAAFRFS